MNDRFSTRPASSQASLPPAQACVRGTSGFSLVEVVLAIGVVAFAFVTLFGLLPSGLNMFRKAMDVSVGAQIFQKVVDDARQSDFMTLVDASDTHAPGGTTVAFRAPLMGAPLLRYFDEAGSGIVPDKNGGQSGASLTPLQQVQVVYYVNTRIVTTTGLPVSTVNSGSSTPFQARYLATVTVQIASNPGNAALTFDTTTQLFKSPPPAGVLVTTYTALVAKSD